MATSQIEEKNIQQSSYLIPASTVTTTGQTTCSNETQLLCDIKLICTRRKKKTKRYTYLTFVESRPLISSTDPPCIEILGNKTNQSISISLDDCISYEYFDTTNNDFQSYLYIYFESYTIIIYFSDEHVQQKPLVIKHLDHMYKQKFEQVKEPILAQEIGDLITTEQILHTFDIKLIPHENIIPSDHVLVGPARIYFTTTDLYIASLHCKQTLLRTTITSQCPTKDKQILCIPYFTIKHYGNRSKLFLVELGKSNYGNGEIHMSCSSSSLASTIHLLVSPVIEERPLILSSAFQNQLLTNKRMEKSKHIHPPVQLTQGRKSSVESLSKPTSFIKSPSLFGFFRKLAKRSNSLDQTDTNEEEQSTDKDSSDLFNKFVELNIDETKFSDTRLPTKSNEDTHQETSIETTNGTYIDMGPTVRVFDEPKTNDDKRESTTASVDVGVNTIISIAPHVHSVIIVGTTVHLIAEERTVFPIGKRSFTSPASAMQPFKAQLTGQTDPISIDAFTSSSPTPPSSLLLTYAFVTFNSKNSPTSLCDSASIDRRLNSELSLISLSHQQQPSNIYSFGNILSSSASSHIFRTLSFSTNINADNQSTGWRNSNGNIIVFDENLASQTSDCLLGPPSVTIDKIVPPSSSLMVTNEEKQSRNNDCYALLDSNHFEADHPSSSSSVLARPSRISDQTVTYSDVLFSTNAGDDQQICSTYDEKSFQFSDPLEEKSNRTSTIFYTDTDFHQTQRRDRIAQYTTVSKKDEQIPPFLL